MDVITFYFLLEFSKGRNQKKGIFKTTYKMRKYPMTTIETISRLLLWKMFVAILFKLPDTRILKNRLKWIKAHCIFCWNLAKARINTKGYLDIDKI